MLEQGVLTLKNSNNNVLIIGTGAWGTALGCMLFDTGINVKMFGTNQNQVNDLNVGKNKQYFGNNNLNFFPFATTEFDQVCSHNDYIVFAIPTNAYNDFVQKYKNKIDKDAIFIIASKGLEPTTGLALDEYLKIYFPNKICSILGPGFANEVVKREKTFVNAISSDIKIANDVANLFTNKNFIVKPIDDFNGATTLASFKNALAILFGLLDYQKVSINTKSAILALAIQEIENYIKKNDGKTSTINEFCGIGDIFLTCTDLLSRNYQFGYKIGDIGINKLVKENKTTVEGYKFINSFFIKNESMKNDFFIFYMIYLLVNGKIDHKKIVDSI